MHRVVLCDERTIDALGGLVPAAALARLPRDIAAAADVLGVAPKQLKHMRGGALQAELDVPTGFWRFWPERGVAFWVGRSQRAVVPHVAESARVGLDLELTLLRLHRAGFWLQEATLGDSDLDWSEPLPLDLVVRRLHEDKEVVAITGYWGDESGQVTQAALFRSGDIWVSGPTAAVRWLNIAFSTNA